jgi:trafficking protein particle complex subunit 6
MLIRGRYVEKLAQNRPLMSDPLEIVKFVCKDFWDDVFKKKVSSVFVGFFN